MKYENTALLKRTFSECRHAYSPCNSCRPGAEEVASKVLSEKKYIRIGICPERPKDYVVASCWDGVIRVGFRKGKNPQSIIESFLKKPTA